VPACGSAGVEAGAAGRADQVCPACGFRLPPAAAAELDYLDSLETWIGVRRAEVIAGAVANPADAAVGAAAPASVPAAHSSPVTAAGCLLAVGAFALVTAGLAFTAFAWDLLGPLGQLLVLVLGGIALMVVGWLGSARIPGTATALSITGVLLLVVAAGFLLSSEASGAAWVRALGVGVAACLGVAVGYLQAGRQPGAAVVTSSVFAGLATATLVFAPVLPPGRDEIWSGWWAAGALALSGLVMLGLDLARRRVATPAVPWVGLATSTLVLSVLVAAVTAADRFATAGSGVPPGALAGAVMLAGALALVGVERAWRPERWSPLLGAGVLLLISSLVLLGALGEPEGRGWYAALAAADAAVLGLLAVRLAARQHSAGGVQPQSRSAFAAGIARAALAMGGIAVALAAAVGPAAPLPRCAGVYEGEVCVDAATDAWLETLHPWWSGVLVGLCAAIGAAVVVVLLRRAGRRTADLPLIVTGSIVVGWVGLVLSDSAQRGADPGVVRPAIAAALAVGGLGTLLVLALAKWPVWTIWSAATMASLGAIVAWGAGGFDARALGPELLGVLLAAPLALAGFLTWRRLGGGTSTWVSVAPGLGALLLPPVGAVAAATLDRAFADTAADLVTVLREVVVLAVGVGLAVAGARGRWAGVFWPGVVTAAVVVAAQVVETSSQVPQWVWLSIAGAILMLLGARWEWARRQGHRTREWSATLR
jgi:hypothetical protein